jgi:hypothetical protein
MSVGDFSLQTMELSVTKMVKTVDGVYVPRSEIVRAYNDDRQERKCTILTKIGETHVVDDLARWIADEAEFYGNATIPATPGYFVLVSDRHNTRPEVCYIKLDVIGWEPIKSYDNYEKEECNGYRSPFWSRPVLASWLQRKKYDAKDYAYLIPDGRVIDTDFSEYKNVKAFLRAKTKVYKKYCRLA